MAIFWYFSKEKKKMLIKKVLYCLSFFFRVIDFFWPKNENCIVFGSQQGNSMSGSPKYLFEFIKKNYPKFKVSYYLPLRQTGFLSQVQYIIKFAPTFFQAKILVSSHPPYDFVPFSWSRRKLLINTWHGIPLKCMFFADPGATESSLKDILRTNDLTTFFPVASSIEASVICRCFLLDPRKIIPIGHPRNDNLVNSIPTDIVNKTLPNLPEYSTLILYCPTYRRNALTQFFPFDDFDIDHLTHFLEEKKAIIFTRGHAQDDRSSNTAHSTRIIELGSNLLEEVNDILPVVDILITDYSSIFFDYLLCNKPCIFIPYDREEYERSVGFLFDDYNYWTPGKKVHDYLEFIEAIGEILSGKDTFKDRREELRDLFHYYQKSNTSENIIRFLNEYIYGENR